MRLHGTQTLCLYALRKLRLQHELRRRRLKCEFESEVGPEHEASGMGHMSLVLLNKAKAA